MEQSWATVHYADPLIAFVEISDHTRTVAPLLKRVADIKPALFCLNDAMSERPAPASENALRFFLHDYFPQPSPFEDSSYLRDKLTALLAKAGARAEYDKLLTTAPPPRRAPVRPPSPPPPSWVEDTAYPYSVSRIGPPPPPPPPPPPTPTRLSSSKPLTRRTVIHDGQRLPSPQLLAQMQMRRFPDTVFAVSDPRVPSRHPSRAPPHFAVSDPRAPFRHPSRAPPHSRVAHSTLPIAATSPPKASAASPHAYPTSNPT